MIVAALSIAPVKGMRVQPVDEVALGPIGAEGDRRFVVVDPEQALLLTTRTPALLQVVPLLIGVHNPFHPDWVSFLASSVTALVVTLIAAAWPALRAARVEALDALRYE